MSKGCDLLKHVLVHFLGCGTTGPSGTNWLTDTWVNTLHISALHISQSQYLHAGNYIVQFLPLHHVA